MMTTETRTSLIELRDIYKIYQMGDTEVHASDGVSLKIYKGEFVAIVGQSGSGKSTLMNIIGCLDVPTSGQYLLNGEDVTKAIRENAVSGYASLVSAYPEVRAFLLDMQRALARTHNVIMDGRDIGTVVLPGADVKVFLTASPEERAKRRCRELEQRGQPVDYRQLLEEITQRDYADSHRAAAPLKQAEDAVLLDTSALDFDASLEALLAIVKERVPL